MRAAHEAELRLRVPVFPDDGIAILDALQLLIVDDIQARARRDQRLAQLLGLRREVCDVVQADRAVGGGGRAEVRR